MARANAKEQEEPVMHIGRRLREGALLLLLAVAAYFLLSLANYSPEDPGWSYTGSRDQVENAGGPMGAWFADVLLNLFGLFAYLFPLMIGWSGWLLFKERNPDTQSSSSRVTMEVIPGDTGTYIRMIYPFNIFEGDKLAGRTAAASFHILLIIY